MIVTREQKITWELQTGKNPTAQDEYVTLLLTLFTVKKNSGYYTPKIGN